MSELSVRRVIAVTNPHSGVGRGGGVAATVLTKLLQSGVEVVRVEAESAAASVREVSEALADPRRRPDVVVCIGGDGLMNVLLAAMAHSGVPLGLVPAGTGNDFARELGIPTNDPVAATEIVLRGRTRVLDLGHIESESATPSWFATVVGTGFDAQVTMRANEMRYPRGPLRYTAAAALALLGSYTLPFRIELSGLAPGALDNPAEAHAVLALDAVMAPVGNTRTYGGGMLVCPEATPDDGYLDVTVVGAVSRVAMARLLPALSAGKRIDHPATKRYRARRITISAAGGYATADGEAAGTLPITLQAMPGALTVVVP
ncbi:YegS/Rv2252/BmrU family lipid kinase [Nocardia camponoti]|uniref:Diacylglycerol kinase n=1 Tax=Nocardia camponoti TaxID=1616106 RepID=A0A917QRR7_9NOCA|nr:YegS/Rv2252/BmrU family lipid kinase [Nocardia camponoti]GGK63995.1 diacylglycerol kinase [Nocardia camponoti]